MNRSDQRGSRAGPRVAAARTVGTLATLVRIIGSLAALVLVIYVVLFVGGANPANGITQFFRSFADSLALGFRDLFTPAGEKTRVLVNYGLAALCWLVAGAVLGRLLGRLG